MSEPHRPMWIDSVPEAAASDDLEPLYEKVADPRTGRVDHVMRVHSLHPAGLAAHFELYAAVMTGTASLRKIDRELIAFVVSQTNDCHY